MFYFLLQKDFFFIFTLFYFYILLTVFLVVTLALRREHVTYEFRLVFLCLLQQILSVYFRNIVAQTDRGVTLLFCKKL